MDNAKLEAAFDERMFEIYKRALLDLKYNASRFLQMLHEHRGLRTAQILLHSAKVSEGYSKLWELGRLDLTVEAVIHDDPRWHSLFTPNELATCQQRLSEHGYFDRRPQTSRRP